MLCTMAIIGLPSLWRIRGHSHGDLFVIAKDDFRLIVAAVIDDGVMDTAKRCARVKCGVLDIKSFHQIDNDV